MHRASFSLCLSISLTMGAQINPPGTSVLQKDSFFQKNEPFHLTSLSEVTKRLPDGTTVKCESHNAMFRDSSGRMRIEGEQGTPTKTGCGDRLHVVTIMDVVASDEFIWVFQDGYVDPKHYMHMHISVTDYSRARVSGTAPEGRLIGMDQVHGVPCEVRRSGESLPGGSILAGEHQVNLVDETCTSSEFGNLRESVSNPANGSSYTMLVESLTHEEPVANLFRPPVDYTERPADAGPEHFVPLPSR